MLPVVQFRDARIVRFRDARIVRFRDARIVRFRDARIVRFRDARMARPGARLCSRRLRANSGNTRMVPEVARSMTRSFAVTWDYRCPFARNAHEHLLAGLEAGADWDVRFLVFSLDQTHVEEGGKPVWEEPDRYPALLANLAGVVVRDRLPEQFYAVHSALFAARHDQAMDLRDPAVVAKALDSTGVDAAGVLSEVEAGWPLEVLKEEHSEAVGQLQVFGVPTFVSGDDAVFVRLMHRPLGDSKLAVSTIDRVLDLFAGWPELNEFKHTKIIR